MLKNFDGRFRGVGMYCNNCGKKINGGKFCSSCGNNLAGISSIEVSKSRNLTSDVLPNNNVTNDNGLKITKDKTFAEVLSKNIDKYCEKYRDGKKGMTVDRYLKTANLLPSMRDTSFLTPIILLSFFNIIMGICLGGVLGILIYLFRCVRILGRENTIQVQCEYDIDKIKNTYEYMLKNNRIRSLIIDSYDEEGINIVFKNQTKHKIKFNKKNGFYTVCCRECTNGQYIISGFQNKSSVMMRNSVLVNPILRSYCEYTIK